MSIVMKKSEIDKLKKSSLSNRFSVSDMINIRNMGLDIREDFFPLKNSIELNQLFRNETSFTILASIYDFNFKERTLRIKGADNHLEFIISKFDSEKLKPQYDKNIKSILVELTIRKHKESVCFVENVLPIVDLDIQNYKNLLELRKTLSTKEWKNLILNSLGYDLRNSEGILKDLMLVRLLPYVEKNYSYIELGGYATGKSKFTELFTNSEKISSKISIAQLYYNVKDKKDGLLFTKDVLYIDEADFSTFDNEISTVLLQVLAGNEIQVRDSNVAKTTDVSIISQGNVDEGIEEYKNSSILEKFEKSFNPGAFFDRTNFFIAGWLIPPHERIEIKEDMDIIPLNILEDFLKIQRDKESYYSILNDLSIKLVTTKPSHGRFNKGIEKTISGLLKILYPDTEIDLEAEKEELEKIITLSVFGKYSIFYLTEPEFENSKIEITFKESKIVIDMNILFRDYIEAKENKYFNGVVEEEEIEKEESFSEYRSKWSNDNKENLSERELLMKYKKGKIQVLPIIEEIFSCLNDDKIKEKLMDSFKTVFAYDSEELVGQYYSEELVRERDNFFYSLYIILKFFDYISEYYLEKDKEDVIKKFLNCIIRRDNKNLYVLDPPECNLTKEEIIEKDIKFSHRIVDMSFGFLENNLEDKKFYEYKGEKAFLFYLLKLEIETNLSRQITNHLDVKNIKNELKEINFLESDTLSVSEREKFITGEKHFEIYLINNKNKPMEKSINQDFLDYYNQK